MLPIRLWCCAWRLKSRPAANGWCLCGMLQERVFPVKGAGKSAELNWGALEPGTYTLAVYLDQNRNNKLDKGMVGQPLEPYAFSNNARAPFSAPNLEEQRFAHPGKLPVLLLR